MESLNYTEIERPIEPAFENEDPEGWCEVLAWEEARADRLVEENAELREAAGRLVELFNGVVFTHKTHRDRVNFLNARNNLKQLLNK